jgi:two-component system nitrate/nitrite response regulator NarL
VTLSSQEFTEPTRVLIITGDNMTGELLKNAFARGRKEFDVDTSIGSSQKVIAKLEGQKPHVAIICEDLEDGPNAGFKVLHKLRDSQHQSAPIMLLQSPKPNSVIDAFREGARGVFYRTNSLKALSKCIRMVRQGQIWASNDDLEHILSALSRFKQFRFDDEGKIRLLTRREEEVVRLVADGLKNREIAQRLNVKEHSVRNYLYRIFEKVGVSTRVELILYALNQWDR